MKALNEIADQHQNQTSQSYSSKINKKSKFFIRKIVQNFLLYSDVVAFM